MPLNLLVTGSSGLIGSEVVAHFAKLGWRVHGIDNNQRGILRTRRRHALESGPVIARMAWILSQGA